MSIEDFKKQLEVYKEIMKKYTPTIVTSAGVAMFVDDISHRKNVAMMQALNTLANYSELYRSKYLRKFKSNNWLKMHGYPMRRKGH